jgi:hypothetical protein
MPGPGSSRCTWGRSLPSCLLPFPPHFFLHSPSPSCGTDPLLQIPLRAMVLNTAPHCSTGSARELPASGMPETPEQLGGVARV